MIIFFYGENDFKLKKKAKELEDRFVQELGSEAGNIFKFSGEQFDLNELLAQIKSKSLFSSRKMIIISDLLKASEQKIFNHLQEKLDSAYLEKSNDVFLFLEKNLKNNAKKDLVKLISGKELSLNLAEKTFFKALSQGKFSQEFKKFSPQDLSQFIHSEFQKNGLTISPKAYKLLLALNSDNIWQLDNEIKKLIYFKTGDQDKVIQEKDVEIMGFKLLNDDIFSLSDSLSKKNIPQSLRILERLRQSNLELSFILKMLIRHFKILWQIRQLLDQNYNSQRILANLKLHPFVVNKGINQAKYFEASKIKEIFNDLSQIDKSTRHETINPWLQLNVLLLKL